MDTLLKICPDKKKNGFLEDEIKRLKRELAEFCTEEANVSPLGRLRRMPLLPRILPREELSC